MDFLTFVQALVNYFIAVTLGHIIGAVAILVGGTWVVGVVARFLTAGARRSHVKPALVDLLGAIVLAAGWILIAAGVLQALNLNELAIAVGGSISLVPVSISASRVGKRCG